ncbi:hypothetical protein JF66_18720, partial [Cryobacterium sp. MLB-32]|uniref:DUF3846 domain-containing protein n=1 Tax=Cryobacterium sp. MLB-32 TaxID=1529318 RepID=UPI0004E77748
HQEATTCTIDKTDTVTSIQNAIGCNNFDVVSLEDDIDLFVDDEGAINGSPLNLGLTIIAHALGTPAVLFGNAIALRCDPNTGDSRSLTVEQLHRLTQAIETKPGPEVIERLSISLAPLPAIVQLLRTL